MHKCLATFDYQSIDLRLFNTAPLLNNFEDYVKDLQQSADKFTNLIAEAEAPFYLTDKGGEKFKASNAFALAKFLYLFSNLEDQFDQFTFTLIEQKLSFIHNQIFESLKRSNEFDSKSLNNVVPGYIKTHVKSLKEQFNSIVLDSKRSYIYDKTQFIALYKAKVQLFNFIELSMDHLTNPSLQKYNQEFFKTLDQISLYLKSLFKSSMQLYKKRMEIQQKILKSSNQFLTMPLSQSKYPIAFILNSFFEYFDKFNRSFLLPENERNHEMDLVLIKEEQYQILSKIYPEFRTYLNEFLAEKECLITEQDHTRFIFQFLDHYELKTVDLSDFDSKNARSLHALVDVFNTMLDLYLNQTDLSISNGLEKDHIINPIHLSGLLIPQLIPSTEELNALISMPSDSVVYFLRIFENNLTPYWAFQRMLPIEAFHFFIKKNQIFKQFEFKQMFLSYSLPGPTRSKVYLKSKKENNAFQFFQSLLTFHNFVGKAYSFSNPLFLLDYLKALVPTNMSLNEIKKTFSITSETKDFNDISKYLKKALDDYRIELDAMERYFNFININTIPFNDQRHLIQQFQVIQTHSRLINFEPAPYITHFETFFYDLDNVLSSILSILLNKKMAHFLTNFSSNEFLLNLSAHWNQFYFLAKDDLDKEKQQIQTQWNLFSNSKISSIDFLSNQGSMLNDIAFKIFDQLRSIVSNETISISDSTTDQLNSIAYVMTVSYFQLNTFKSNSKILKPLFHEILMPWLMMNDENYDQAFYHSWINHYKVSLDDVNLCKGKYLEILSISLLYDSFLQFLKIIDDINQQFVLNEIFNGVDYKSFIYQLELLPKERFDVGNKNDVLFFPFIYDYPVFNCEWFYLQQLFFVLENRQSVYVYQSGKEQNNPLCYPYELFNIYLIVLVSKRMKKMFDMGLKNIENQFSYSPDVTLSSIQLAETMDAYVFIIQQASDNIFHWLSDTSIDHFNYLKSLKKTDPDLFHSFLSMFMGDFFSAHQDYVVSSIQLRLAFFPLIRQILANEMFFNLPGYKFKDQTSRGFYNAIKPIVIQKYFATNFYQAFIKQIDFSEALLWHILYDLNQAKSDASWKSSLNDINHYLELYDDFFQNYNVSVGSRLEEDDGHNLLKSTDEKSKSKKKRKVKKLNSLANNIGASEAKPEGFDLKCLLSTNRLSSVVDYTEEKKTIKQLIEFLDGDEFNQMVVSSKSIPNQSSEWYSEIDHAFKKLPTILNDFRPSFDFGKQHFLNWLIHVYTVFDQKGLDPFINGEFVNPVPINENTQSPEVSLIDQSETIDHLSNSTETKDWLEAGYSLPQGKTEALVSFRIHSNIELYHQILANRSKDMPQEFVDACFQMLIGDMSIQRKNLYSEWLIGATNSIYDSISFYNFDIQFQNNLIKFNDLVRDQQLIAIFKEAHGFLSEFLKKNGCIFDSGLVKRKFDTPNLIHFILNRAIHILIDINKKTLPIK